MARKGVELSVELGSKDRGINVGAWLGSKKGSQIGSRIARKREQGFWAFLYGFSVVAVLNVCVVCAFLQRSLAAASPACGHLLITFKIVC